jgi:hypothetical protein
MTTTIPVGGAHETLIDRVYAYLRDPAVSDDEARWMLRMVCGVAFRDGVTATHEQTLRDLELLKAPAARTQ